MASRVDEIYKPALSGKKIPTLTLDNKWHKLFTQTGATEEIRQLEQQLNDLLKEQGKLNTEIKEIKKLKTKLMNEIVAQMDRLQDKEPGKEESRLLSEQKRLISECNEKAEEKQDALLDLPKEIQQVNMALMLATMDSCYETLHKNTRDIDEITKWVSEVRVELKKRLIEKQEKETLNHNLYSYMHDIFGADVIEIFDMSYNPEERVSSKKKS